MTPVRLATPADWPFVFSSWLQSYRRGSVAVTLIDSKSYYTEHHRLVERFLSKSDSIVLVATPEGDPGVILGYVAASAAGETLHYVYVKESCRGLGLGKALVAALPSQPQRVTHLTNRGAEWGHKADVIYNPYLFLGAL